MDYKSVMKQDYDKKIRFNKKALFCYSKKKLKKEYKDQGISHSENNRMTQNS